MPYDYGCGCWYEIGGNCTNCLDYLLSDQYRDKEREEHDKCDCGEFLFEPAEKQAGKCNACREVRV